MKTLKRALRSRLLAGIMVLMHVADPVFHAPSPDGLAEVIEETLAEV